MKERTGSEPLAITGFISVTDLEQVVQRIVDDALARRFDVTPEPWYDTDAAATYLAVKRDRVWDLVQQGKLEHRRDGDGRRGPLRFRREWLDTYLERESSR